MIDYLVMLDVLKGKTEVMDVNTKRKLELLFGHPDGLRRNQMAFGLRLEWMWVLNE